MISALFNFLTRGRRGLALVSHIVALASVVMVIVLYYSQNSFLEAFEAKSYDLRFSQWRGPVKANEQIAIIAIDEKSIKELGRFPWRRDVYVELLQQLTAAEAKAVLFDIFFSETESTQSDRALADALKRAGNVTLAVAFDLDNELNVTGGRRNIPIIGSSAKGVAHINYHPENDGINRRNMLYLKDGETLVPSLGLAGAMAALDVDGFQPGSFHVSVDDRRIPVDWDNAMWVNYVGPSRSFPYYSFTDVMHGRVDAALLEDKVLFVGATALGIYDLRVTPFDKNSPGVEVHANVADNIISGHFIRQSGIEALFDILSIIVLGFATYYLSLRLPYYAVLPVFLLILSAYLWIVYLAFVAGHWLSMIYPSLAASFALMTGGGYRYLVLERLAREMRSMFSSYLSPKLVARLEREPESARIGGDSKEITVAFTDIRGFTSFSEKHKPQEVVAQLNEYLDAMVQVVDRFDGTVDKFMGDGIMVYWGAPLPQSKHAQLAMNCMLAMEETMQLLCFRWREQGKEPFTLRAGIESGEVVAGNIGSRSKKMEYTVIGDPVNMGARLEGAAKYYGVEFLVGEAAYRLSCGDFHFREIDKIRVLGKDIPATVYELLSPASEPEPPLVGLFAAALKLYRERHWDEAREAFQAILGQFPTDRPSGIYLERCGFFADNPPEEDWDGVFNRLSK
jgi:adenylate cyclase